MCGLFPDSSLREFSDASALLRSFALELCLKKRGLENRIYLAVQKSEMESLGACAEPFLVGFTDFQMPSHILDCAMTNYCSGADSVSPESQKGGHSSDIFQLKIHKGTNT
jgi:hypothetical protein